MKTTTISMQTTVLITAYAVNPYKGSENGIAWNIISQMASRNKVIAITRCNNQPAIDKFLAEDPLAKDLDLQFEYFDLPYWMRFWKRGGRGSLIYHYLWHLSIIFFIKRKQLKFDLAHHLNFNNDWTPSFLWVLGKPLIWGPIGHHPKIPYEYIRQYGLKASFLEQLKWGIKKCFWTFDPFLKITKTKAKKIIALNSSVQEVLKVRDKKIIIIPAAGNTKPNIKRIENDKFTVLSIGRLVALKGFDMTIHAFATFFQTLSDTNKKKAQLIVIGKGKQKDYLRSIHQHYQLPPDAIQFIDWMERKKLANYYASAKVFLFPSHEGAGMVVPEALSYGLPVVCFDNIGPGEFIDEQCGFQVPYTNYKQSVKEFAEILSNLQQDEKLRNQLSQNAFRRFQEHFEWKVKGDAIQSVYEQVSGQSEAVKPLSPAYLKT